MTQLEAARKGIVTDAMNAVAADEIFSILMGESPELRRQFIEENATLIQLIAF